MAPKLSKARLSEITPTAEELQKAKELLASYGSDTKRSKMVCMTRFLKANPDEQAESSWGLDRQKYLEAYIVHTLRAKEGIKSSTNTESASKATEKFWEVHPMSAEKMDEALGKAKAQHLRLGKYVQSQPCTMSGSTEEHMLEWLVPNNWQRMTQADFWEFKVQNQATADKEDLDNLRSMKDSPTVDAPDTTIKVEKTEGDELTKLQARVTSFKENLTTHLREIQDIEVESQQILKRAAAAKDKYAGPLLDDCDKHIKATNKASKLLSKMCTEDFEDGPIPKLLDQIDTIRKKHEEVLVWANRFGYVAAPASGRKRRAPRSSTGS